MKQFLDEVQTAHLISLGFPKPKSVSKLTLDLDMDTIPSFNYSIGELLEFLPKQIENENELPKVLEIHTCRNYWIVYYSNFRKIGYYYHSKELIDAIYNMVVELKKDEVI